MNYSEKYINFLEKYANIQRPLTVVCDGSNGTTGIILEKLTNIPNLKLIPINTNPDPDFPAHGPNPLMPGATDMLSQKVLEVKADFGVAFDADGDRAFFVDNTGRTLPSFITSAIWFNFSQPPFVADELAYLSLTTSGVFSEKDIIPARIGAIFIKEAMQKSSASLGVEFSGHFYFKDFFGLDSGIFSLIYTANVLSKQDKTLSQLYTDFDKQALVNTNIKLKNVTWDIVKEVISKETTSIAKQTFNRDGLTIITNHGWINVRTSNTEPLARISVGAKTKELAEQDMNLISNIIQKIDEGTA